MLSVPVISIIVCIRILLPDRRGVRSTIVLFLLFINVFIFYLHDEVQKSYIETAKQEEMKIQMSQYAKELEMMMKSQDRLNKIHHDYKHHLTKVWASCKRTNNSLILRWKSAKVMLFIHITKLIASGQDKLTALGFQ